MKTELGHLGIKKPWTMEDIGSFCSDRLGWSFRADHNYSTTFQAEKLGMCNLDYAGSEEGRNYFKLTYIDLPDCWDLSRPILAPHGVLLTLAEELDKDTIFSLAWNEEARKTRPVKIQPAFAYDAKEPQPPTPSVYFISPTEGGNIKIGWAIRPSKRLSQLQRMSPVPLKIIGTIPGDLTSESSLHRLFAHLRLHGEWFAPDEELLDYIKANAKGVAP